MRFFNITIPIELLSLFIGIVFIILFALIIWALINTFKTNKKMEAFLTENSKNDIARAILEYYEKCNKMLKNSEDTLIRLKNVEKKASMAVQKIGCVRYDAFEGCAGQLSFALAVLDNEDSGFVLNGIYAREEMLTYLKQITKGNCDVELTQQEAEAIVNAKINFENKLIIKEKKQKGSM